jgi:CRP-like cAMP-binding protein
MEERLPLLRALPLFRDMTDGEILRTLECFHARELRFDRAQIVWEACGRAHWGVILEGGVTVQQEDQRGNRCLLGEFGPGEFLDGDALAGAGVSPFFVSAHAGTSVLLLEREAPASPLGEGCESHRAHLLFLRNAVQAMVRRERLLLHKIDYLSKRTTRDKILSFLAIQAARHGARRFNVPYTRQELADLLAVDRSAMCTELTRMQNDGLIRFERKRFELLGEK